AIALLLSPTASFAYPADASTKLAKWAASAKPGASSTALLAWATASSYCPVIVRAMLDAVNASAFSGSSSSARSAYIRALARAVSRSSHQPKRASNQCAELSIPLSAAEVGSSARADEDGCHLALYLPPYVLRNRNAARFGDTLKSGRDIDAVAQDVV